MNGATPAQARPTRGTSAHADAIERGGIVRRAQLDEAPAASRVEKSWTITTPARTPTSAGLEIAATGVERLIEVAGGKNVIEITHALVTLPDGVKLKARLWLPADAAMSPCPLVIESLPYGAAYGTVARDERNHVFLASRGIGAVRLDIRGTGESQGVVHDEYTSQERCDLVDAARALVGQPFASGSWALMGNSWGGFISAQVAAEKPAGLEAIVMSCASEDRYRDDVHYRQGLMVGEQAIYGTSFPNFVCQPPDPLLVGPKWEAMWKARAEAIEEPVLVTWMRHPDRSTPYWDTPSDDARAIDVPVLAFGGAADAYCNSVRRMVEAGGGKTKGVIGPGAHGYPDTTSPSPESPLLFREMTERFLRKAFGMPDAGLGSADAPDLVVYMLDSVPPSEQHPPSGVRAGRWLAIEDAQGKRELRDRTFVLGTGERTVRSPLTLGVAAGKYCPFGAHGQLAPDQRVDDARSSCFDIPVHDSDLAILGGVKVNLRLSSSTPSGSLIVRLCDVAPDGQSTRITYGGLRLTHREGDRAPAPLAPGVPYDVTVTLDDIAYEVPKGHTLRVAVSTQYWPAFWPDPDEPELRIDAARSSLIVPEYIGGDTPARMVTTPAAPERESSCQSTAEAYGTAVHFDEATGVQTTTIHYDGGVSRDATGLVSSQVIHQQLSIREGDPFSARADVTWFACFTRGDFRASVETQSIVTRPSRAGFVVESLLRLKSGDRIVSERRWRHEVPRQDDLAREAGVPSRITR